MSRVTDLENEVSRLSPDELQAFRRWFAKFDADAWDRQFEEDVKAGKLDHLAARARRDHAAGRSTKL